MSNTNTPKKNQRPQCESGLFEEVNYYIIYNRKKTHIVQFCIVFGSSWNTFAGFTSDEMWDEIIPLLKEIQVDTPGQVRELNNKQQESRVAFRNVINIKIINNKINQFVCTVHMHMCNICWRTIKEYLFSLLSFLLQNIRFVILQIQ